MTVRPPRPPRNPGDVLPLFTWAAHRERRFRVPAPLHVRILARRCGLPLARAAVISELAGIGPEVR